MNWRNAYLLAGFGALLGTAVTAVARAGAGNRRPVLARASSARRAVLEAELLAEQYANQSATGEGMAEASGPQRKELA